MSAPQIILDLVARFEQQLDAYQSGQYNETQLRREFLDPFFKALGWDMDNVQGFAEAYKDVIHEDQVRVGGLLKAPDYSFRIGGNRKFFLEAKKPSVAIKDEPAPAFQLRRYAWSAKLPLSILSDFEELAIYDGRFKPHKNDPAGKARIFYCTFREYAEKWDWIYERFSRDAVLKGAFDKYAESTRAKRGTSQVDDEFLATIEGWRKELAQNLALRNPRLTQRELNFAVQRIIDRIIFLRICEDRGIEDYGRLQALVNGDRIYPRLAKLFEAADDRYNSGLFHFKNEPGRHEAPDELTLDLDIDDKLLRGLLRDLYYPESPYEFSVLDADILGQVYEQFLGKVIRLTEGHRAVVDDKPEVKKAGGVYYTPTYIVDYIVRQTVGKLVDDCSRRRKEADLTDSNSNPPPHVGGYDARTATAILNRVAKLRILDPACGSGSFLIGAYQFLLDWHLQFYLANDPLRWAKGARPALVQTSKGWRLTIAERKRILLNNIYGVDIDSQAVEVTKLSLLLKVLEGETGQTLQSIFNLFRERALPDLGDNIKCGNSLIGPDFYEAVGRASSRAGAAVGKPGGGSSGASPHQPMLFQLTDEERYRINVFDWRAEFPEIFRGSRRESAQSDSGRGKDGADSRRLLQGDDGGGFDAVIGNPPYVRPHNLQSVDKEYFWKTYKTFTHKSDLYCCFVERVMSLLKSNGRFSFIVSHGWLRLNSFQELRQSILNNSKIHELVELPFRVFKNAIVDTGIFVLERGKAGPTHKLSVVECGFKAGRARFVEKKKLLQSAFRKTFQNVFDLSISPETESIKDRMREGDRLGDHFDICFGLKTAADDKFLHFSKGLHKEDKRLLRGDDIKRYSKRYKGEFVWYVPEKMRQNKATARPGEPARFEQAKVLVKDTSKDFGCTFDGEGFYVKDVLIVIPKPASKPPVDLRFITGLLNSRLMFFYYRTTFPTLHVQNEELASLPLPHVNVADKAAHDRMVSLVETMLALHQQLAAARTPQEQTALERQIAATDTQIDRLVYDLYGLTEDEIKIVEGAAK